MKPFQATRYIFEFVLVIFSVNFVPTRIMHTYTSYQFLPQNCHKNTIANLEPLNHHTLFSIRSTNAGLQSEMMQLDTRVDRLSTQLKGAATPPQLLQQMAPFLQQARRDLDTLKQGLAEAEKVRIEVASYFCEDSNAFKLEECFKTFQTFCAR